MKKTENTTLAIRETLKHSGAQAAERQLTRIGDTEGDDQLTILVADLNSAEVAQIVGLGDFTKPSIAVHFLSPKQFLGALERLGAKWGEIGDSAGSTIHTLKEDLADFVLSVVLHAESRRRSFIEALAQDPLGGKMLVALPLWEQGCPEFLENYESATHQKGTWQELYVEVEAVDEKFFDFLRSQVVALTKNDKACYSFLKRTLQALSDKASGHVGQETVDNKEIEKIFSI